MSSTAKPVSDSFKWQDFNHLQSPDASQLENIKSHLDLVLLALEAIADLSSEAILQAAKDLNLKSFPSSGDRKKLDIEEARSLVLIICYLANQHQELLRRAVSLLEQVTIQNQAPHEVALLGNYLDKFINYYQARISNTSDISSTFLTQLAWKLLIDLLFYSGNNGHRLLWLAIFDAAQSSSNQ
ncbi:MAG: DUF3038 domain-containing protein [Waterburya sp.]